MKPKKRIIIDISIMVLLILCNYFAFNLGLNKGKEYKTNITSKGDNIINDASFVKSDSPIKTDYPLIDVYFNKNDSWLLLNCENYLGANDNYEMITDTEILESFKEYLSVDTFPVGRGITPKGKIFILKDGKVLKEVPYFKVEIDSELKKEFKKVKKTEVIDFIKDYLI